MMLRFRAGYAHQAAREARPGLALLALALFLGACSYQPGGSAGGASGIDNPIERKFTWFSYLDAADIRNSCAAGGPDQLRLVYNGQFYDHVRAYDVTGGNQPALTSRARGSSGNLLNLEFDSLEGLFGPWNFQKSQTNLTPGEWAELNKLLKDSGFTTTDQSGMRLHSQDFYWLVAGCENGRFHYNAWAARSSSTPLDRAKFVEFLLKRDATGIAFKSPRPVSYMEKSGGSKGRTRDYTGHFIVTVHSDGIGRPGI